MMIVMTKIKICKLFQIGSHVLAYSNSCVNPILYAYFSTPFRNAFIKLFGRKQNNNNTVIDMSEEEWLEELRHVRELEEGLSSSPSSSSSEEEGEGEVGHIGPE